MVPHTAPGSEKWECCHFLVPISILASCLGGSKAAWPTFYGILDGGGVSALLAPKTNRCRT